jgi:hypothetical protein
MSFVGYKYAREKGLDLPFSSDGFEPTEEEEDDDPLAMSYNSLHPGYATSVVSESPSDSYFR